MENILLNILYTVIGAAVTFLLSVIGLKVSKLIDAKVKNEKVAELLKAAANSVTSAVKAANQTYVDALKKDGKFDAQAKQTALTLATETARNNITEDVKKAIEDTYGNFETWLTTTTEAAVADTKK